MAFLLQLLSGAHYSTAQQALHWGRHMDMYNDLAANYSGRLLTLCKPWNVKHAPTFTLRAPLSLYGPCSACVPVVPWHTFG